MKKIRVVLVAALMAVTLSACGTFEMGSRDTESWLPMRQWAKRCRFIIRAAAVCRMMWQSGLK